MFVARENKKIMKEWLAFALFSHLRLHAVIKALQYRLEKRSSIKQNNKTVKTLRGMFKQLGSLEVQ